MPDRPHVCVFCGSSRGSRPAYTEAARRTGSALARHGLGLTELIVAAGMHERKALMASRSSGFITLPGGVGTYEEFFEVLTWAGLGLHRKPIGVLNVEGYFDPLLALLDHAVTERFVRPEHLDWMIVSDQPEALVADLLGRTPPAPGPKWIDLDET